ncbi:antitoxin VbhA family protein [Microbacterium sp. NPDC078814]|jgi:Antitoxin VbhA|uniref:antitoxin VbhA family protein n=1 Tax=Microbacterium sp. NPDC078814 TaxID=3154767 RepID=UPI00344E2D6F
MGSDDHVRTREERLDGVLEAFHSCRLDGLAPTRDALRDAQDYIDGLRSLEEILEEVRRRHTRNPDQEQS